MTYLKLTGCDAGLLLNFNVTALRAGVRRLTHPDLYSRRSARLDVSNAGTGAADE